MKKSAIILLLVLACGLFGWGWYWGAHPAPGLDLAQRIDHKFVVAAYAVAWTVQLGYLIWLGLKWQAQKRYAARLDHGQR
ncbi:MAG: hypothetical protein ACRD27_07265 [Terracidiphilus sp.]